jgi:hypothetical protein
MHASPLQTHITIKTKTTHMKKILVALSVLGLALCLSGPLSAQPLPNEQGDGTQTGGSPIAAPIGGGAGILVAFGIAYAVSRFNFTKKEE